MRKLSGLLAVVALFALATFSVAGDEGPWFDLENCALCNNFNAEEGLMDHMQWETHMITNGIMTVTMVGADYEESFHRAVTKMEATVAKMQGGESVHLCGFCTSYGSLMMSGAKVEEVESKAGYINLMTADNPEVVKMIQAHGQRTIDAYATLLAEQGAGGR